MVTPVGYYFLTRLDVDGDYLALTGMSVTAISLHALSLLRIHSAQQCFNVVWGTYQSFDGLLTKECLVISQVCFTAFDVLDVGLRFH